MFNKIKSVLNKEDKSYVAASPIPRGFLSWVIEGFTGAWQSGISYKREDVLCYHAVFSCVSLISGDISKLPIKLMSLDNDGIWNEIKKTKYQVLNKPNNYQTLAQFLEAWLNSKLIRGNAYVYKEIDNRGNIVALHVLNPDLVLPLISDDGQVFYQITKDNLAGINSNGITVPAEYIIHDRFNCFYHPLVGLSPLYASGLPAYMGNKILENSARLFANGGRPSGILTVPESISAENAKELSESWQANYGGANYGKVAILGGSVKYQPLSITAVEGQMVEQLKISSEMVCSTFHVPSYKVIGNSPSYNNIEAQEQSYYSQCLQKLIEAIEALLKEGLDMPEEISAELDLNNLLRMDSKTRMDTLVLGVKGGLYTPNEARKMLNKKPIEGGDTVWLQQQNYPIEVLAQRRQAPVDSAINSNDNSKEDEENAEEAKQKQQQLSDEQMIYNLLTFSNEVKEMSFEL